MNATSILCRAQDAAAAGASRSGSGSGRARPSRSPCVCVCGRRHFNFVTKLGRTQLTGGCHCLEEGDAVHGGICRAPEPLKSHFRTAAEEQQQEQAEQAQAKLEQQQDKNKHWQQKLGIRDLRAHK